VINLLLTYFIWLVVCEEARRAGVEIHEMVAPYRALWMALLLRFAPVIFYALEALHRASVIA
jgi:hypothetical protein